MKLVAAFLCVRCRPRSSAPRRGLDLSLEESVHLLDTRDTDSNSLGALIGPCGHGRSPQQQTTDELELLLKAERLMRWCGGGPDRLTLGQSLVLLTVCTEVSELGDMQSPQSTWSPPEPGNGTLTPIRLTAEFCCRQADALI